MNKLRLILDFLFWMLTRLFKPFTKQKNTRILTIRIDALGDFSLWLPVYNEFINQDNFEHDLIGNSLWHAAAKKYISVENIYSINKHKFKSNYIYRYKMAFRMLRFYKEVHYPSFSMEWDGVFLSMIPFSSKKRGWSGDKQNISSFGYQLAKIIFDERIQDMNIPSYEGSRNNQFYRINRNVLFNELVTDKNGPIIIAPGAGSHKRLWPIDDFVKMAEYFSMSFSNEIYIVGARGEEELGIKFETHNVKNLVGKTSVVELFELSKKASLVLCNESGIAQIAYIFKIPCVSIVGGGHFGRFLPTPTSSTIKSVFYKMDCFNCNWKCNIEHSSEGAFPCIKNVKIEEVKKICSHLLRELNET